MENIIKQNPFKEREKIPLILGFVSKLENEKKNMAFPIFICPFFIYTLSIIVGRFVAIKDTRPTISKMGNVSD